MNFWDILWLLIWGFFFISYLMVLFNVLIDVFRDRETSGFAKAAWVFFLVVVPAITALVYLVMKGKGMAERAQVDAQQAEAATQAYIREVAGTSPAEQIAAAQRLLADGAITDAEFATLKAKALA